MNPKTMNACSKAGFKWHPASANTAPKMQRMEQRITQHAKNKKITTSEKDDQLMPTLEGQYQAVRILKRPS